MAWSGGTFSRVHDWTDDEGAAIDIEASRMDAEDDNFETGINSCLHKAGQNAATGNLNIGSNRLTAVGAATALTDAPNATQVINQDLQYYVDSGSADAYVLTPDPAISAYNEGMRFVFRAANTNTGASSLNINAKGALDIETNDGNPLTAGMIVAGGYYEVVHNGTGSSRFVLMSPHSVTGFNGMPINTKNTNYPLELSDAGKTIYKASGGSGETITVPANASVAFPTGTEIDIVNQGGGTLSLAITTDTMTLAGAGTTGTRTLADDGWARLKKVTSTSWIISGDGLT